MPVIAEAGKRVAISKANGQMIAAIAIASFVAVFCLIATKAAWGQNRYQAKVTTEKEKAKHQLDTNIQAFNSLLDSYKKFDSQDPNVLNGSKTGSGDNDGTNSKLILDALPSSYDFPALASSLEKVLNNQGVRVTGIGGSDDQLNQQNNTGSATPEPLAVPFTFTVSGVDYKGVNSLLTKLQQSIRPMQIDILNLSGSSTNMTVNVSAHTYYQPGKNLSITKKVVK